MKNGESTWTADPAHSPHMRTLYTDHRAWLHGWLQRRLRSACDAADLTQDTFARIWARRDLAAIREPRAFLTTVAHGLLVNFRRRKQIERAYLASATPIAGAAPASAADNPEDRAIVVESLAQIDRLLDGLPAPVRRAFLLAQIERWSYAQIAEDLGVSISSVKQYLRRAQDHCLARQADRSSAEVPPIRRRRRVSVAASVVALVAGVAAWAIQLWPNAVVPAAVVQELRTEVGQKKTFILADGTRITLNTASHVAVAYSRHARQIEQKTGEILVQTSRDPVQPARPFYVQTASGRATALGTRFTVRVEGDGTTVAVMEGRVALAPAVGKAAADESAASGSRMGGTRDTSEPTVLEPGERARLSTAGILRAPAVGTSDPAWTRGMLIADDQPLCELIDELARYRPEPLLCGAGVAHRRISGAFPLNDIDRALDLISSTLQLSVRRNPAGETMIEARAGQPE
jgi:RNA polymerase sigma factor (sigma-70 family)